MALVSFTLGGARMFPGVRGQNFLFFIVWFFGILLHYANDRCRYVSGRIRTCRDDGGTSYGGVWLGLARDEAGIG